MEVRDWVYRYRLFNSRVYAVYPFESRQRLALLEFVRECHGKTKYSQS